MMPIHAITVPRKTIGKFYRLPADLADELKHVADAAELSETLIVRDAIREKLRKLRGKKVFHEIHGKDADQA